MRILLLGSGGREHALARKLIQSPLCESLFIAPGNPGTAQCGTNVALSLTDFESIASFCLDHQIQQLVVGPEEPLVKGIYNYFAETPSLSHIQVIGPSKEAAQLEGSKAFAKRFMQDHGIPTAAYRSFNATNFEDGILYLAQHTLPIVLKADGLAAGKGVVICQTHEEAQSEFKAMIQEQKFGDASANVVVEEFLTGIECSFFVLSDGEHYHLLPSAKDYKRIGEGDTGLNTGGMGAISPVPFVDDIFTQKVTERIILPTIHGLQKENLIYKGFIFIGLIKVNEDPYVIEYNCRMGDPETEVVMPRLESDLVELFQHVSQGTLHQTTCTHHEESAATVVLVSQGYPEAYEKNKVITLPSFSTSIIFHAGTQEIQGKLVSSGGRVMAITSLHKDLKHALKMSYQTIDQIHFEGKNFRRDIGYEFV
jgi:phosphoribosylamine--glycine ligase